jgi:hypothetical protein
MVSSEHKSKPAAAEALSAEFRKFEALSSPLSRDRLAAGDRASHFGNSPLAAAWRSRAVSQGRVERVRDVSTLTR